MNDFETVRKYVTEWGDMGTVEERKAAEVLDALDRIEAEVRRLVSDWAWADYKYRALKSVIGR